MELCYENLKNKPETFLAFTGSSVKEFQILLQAFTLVLERHVQQNRLPLELRQRDHGGGRKARLSTCEDRLLLILVSRMITHSHIKETVSRRIYAEV